MFANPVMKLNRPKCSGVQRSKKFEGWWLRLEQCMKLHLQNRGNFQIARGTTGVSKNNPNAWTLPMHSILETGYAHVGCELNLRQRRGLADTKTVVAGCHLPGR